MVCDFGLSRSMPESRVGKESLSSRRVRDKVKSHMKDSNIPKSELKTQIENYLAKKFNRK